MWRMVTSTISLLLLYVVYSLDIDEHVEEGHVYDIIVKGTLCIQYFKINMQYYTKTSNLHSEKSFSINFLQ